VPVTRAGDIDMYYELHGSGEPLVLIGGLASDISQWGWLTDFCAQTHHVLAFDNRGAGRTDKPDAPYTIPMMANDTDALMDAVGMNRATVIGISMGGKIALDLALEHPDRVARLVLVSTRASARLDGSMSRMEMLGVLSGLVFRGKYPQPRYAFSRQREASRSFDCIDRLGEIHVPTTILHGRKDRIAPLREAEAMRRGIAGSQLVTFRGGHLFFLIHERKWFFDSLAAAMTARSHVAGS
jgi:pimeloyl-ACP methyl ester carboxylesterase